MTQRDGAASVALDGQCVVMPDLTGNDHVSCRKRSSKRQAAGGADDNDHAVDLPVGRADRLDAGSACGPLKLAGELDEGRGTGQRAAPTDAANGLWLERIDVEGRLVIRMSDELWLLWTAKC